jgi:hypothetical protein
MTPQDHNKTLGFIYGLIGTLALVGVVVATTLEMRKGASSDLPSTFPSALYFLPIPLLQFLVAYGVLRTKRWARILALLFSMLYVWIFPLGTLLAIYAWWFLHTTGGKQLYVKAKA